MIHNIDEYDPNTHVSVSDIHVSFGALSCIIAYNIECALSKFTTIKSEIGIVSMIRDNIAFKNIVPNISIIDGNSSNVHNDVIRLYGNRNSIPLVNEFKNHVHSKRNLIFQQNDGDIINGSKTPDSILFDINEIIVDAFMKESSKYSADMSGLVYNVLQQIEKYFKAMNVSYIIQVYNIDLLAEIIDEIVEVFNFATDNRMIIDADLPHPFIIFPYNVYLEKQQALEKICIDDIVLLKNDLPEKFNYPLVRTLRGVCSAQGDDMVLYPLNTYKDLNKVKLLIGLGSHRQDVAVCVNYKFVSDALT